MKQFTFVYLIFLFSWGCKGSQSWPPAPADVHLGEASCAACSMIISDDHYGAQLHVQGKQVQFFDDYGCLLNQKRAEDLNQRVVYVRSLDDGKWLRENEASYVVSKKISSPMGFGIAAFATKESAVRFTQQIGDSKIYSSTELIPAAGITRAGFQEKE